MSDRGAEYRLDLTRIPEEARAEERFHRAIDLALDALDLAKKRYHVYVAIDAERDRQDARWGADRRLPSGVWMVVLMQEIVLEARANLEGGADDDDLQAELVQLAALAIMWLESLDSEDRRPADDLLTHVDVARALTYKQPVGANADLGKRPERPPMSDRGAEYRLDQEGADDDLQAELVQVAAVAIAWLESLAGDTIGGPERAGL